MTPLFGSGNFILAKGIVVQELPPGTISLIRFSIAALALFMAVRYQARKGTEKKTIS
jgi:drug/metabolite transporter (DMT)-like permease